MGRRKVPLTFIAINPGKSYYEMKMDQYIPYM
jgi:hypothetical protein